MKEFVREGLALTSEALTPNVNAEPIWTPSSGWARPTWLVAIPLALIVVVAFSPILNNSFIVGWDDHRNFLDNPHFHGLGMAQVRWAWTTFWVGAYQPLAWLLFEAQYVIWQLDPRGYHLTSLLLHAGNAVVLYVLTLSMLRHCKIDFCLERPWACSLSAGLATALFAVHPLRVEAVAWVSCQPYLPCALFSMLSILAYLRAFQTQSSPAQGWLAGSFLLYVMALLFKAVPVGLPVVLLLLDFYPLMRFRDTQKWFGSAARRALWEKVPFVIASVLFMRLAIAAKPDSQFPVEHYGASEGIARACYGTWFYILKTLFPFDLIPFYYSLPGGVNWLSPKFGLSIVATLAVTAGLFLVRGRWPGLIVAWISYLVVLAPNSGIIRIRYQTEGDRYSYLAMLGFVVLAAAGFCWVWDLSSRRRPAAIATIGVGVGAVFVLIPITWNQCRAWRDSETLWAHALAHGGNSSFLVHYNFGAILFEQRKYKAAEFHFMEALRLNPRFDKAHNNLADVLYTEGKYEEAVAHFNEALRLNPGYADPHHNLGVAFQSKGMYSAAEAHYAEAVRLRPDYADAHKNLGFVLYSEGKYEAAANHLTEALRLHQGWADAHNSLATIFSRQRRYREARAHLTEAIRLEPGNVQAHDNLGLVFCRVGNYEGANAEFAEAIRLQPSDPNAYNALAMLLAACPEARIRDGKRAVEYAIRACELTHWKNPIILDTLAAASAEAGDFKAAISTQKQAISLLADERNKDDYQTRLGLYQANKPYRTAFAERAPIESHR